MTSRERSVGRRDSTTRRSAPVAPAQELVDLAREIGPAAAVQRSQVDPATLSSAEVQQLQRALGNQAVGRMLAGRVQRQNGPDQAVAEEEPQEGTLPDFAPAPELAVEKGPSDRRKQDGPPVVATAPTPTAAATPPAGGYKVTIGSVGHQWDNPGGKAVDPFGSEDFEPGYKNVTWKTGKKTVKLNFTLNIKCPWGVKDDGQTDVKSGTDAVVTADNYEQIVKDLTPKKIEKSWRAPRDQFWSKAICERHEKFHSTDDKKWSKGAGKKVVTRYLKGKKVPGADLGTELDDLMKKAMVEMSNANWEFYTGGASSYLSYAGEKRAFGDGKKPYQNLAKAVKKQGKKLKKAAEKKAKEEAKKK